MGHIKNSQLVGTCCYCGNCELDPSNIKEPDQSFHNVGIFTLNNETYICTDCITELNLVATKHSHYQYYSKELEI